jgi:predicted ester cyclase
MSALKDQVRKFYEILWNAHDRSAIPSVLQENFAFRGSLGQEKRGHDGFAEYVDMVHQALGDYRCVIDELVEEGDKVFAKMTFTGVHQAEFLGFQPTWKRVSWAGCALFKFDGDRMSDVWVLGDLKALEDQLKRNAN